MIDAIQLRLGNIVRLESNISDNEFETVDGLDNPMNHKPIRCIHLAGNGIWNFEAQIKGVLLNHEILIAIGFSHEGKESRINDMKLFHVYTKGNYTFNSSHGWWFNGKQLDNQPKYLHQLQNLYFATEIEELTYNPSTPVTIK